MKTTSLAAAVALFALAAFPAHAASNAPPAGSATAAGAINPQQLERIVPGRSTKADVQSLLGAPWRIVQFNDCGQAMDDEADETWEYRGSDPTGSYRVHVEFSDDGVVHLLAKIPDNGGSPTPAKVAPAAASKGMAM